MILHACANSQEEIKLKAELAQPLAELQAAARAIAEVQRECKLEVDADVYVESFRPSLMDIIHAWSKVGAARNGSLKGSGGFQDRKSGVGGLPAQPDGHHPRLDQGAFCRPGPPHLKEERCLVCDSGLHGPDSPRSPEIHGCVATPGGDPAARTAICCSLGFRMAILREATCCTYNINMGVMRCGAPSRMLCKHPWVLASAGLCMQCGSCAEEDNRS